MQSKKYETHLITQELGNCDFKTNVITNGLEKYPSFSLDNKLISIDSFHVVSSSLVSLIENSSKSDYKHLNQEFDSEVLDIIK